MDENYRIRLRDSRNWSKLLDIHLSGEYLLARTLAIVDILTAYIEIGSVTSCLFDTRIAGRERRHDSITVLDPFQM